MLVLSCIINIPIFIHNIELHSICLLSHHIICPLVQAHTRPGYGSSRARRQFRRLRPESLSAYRIQTKPGC